MPTFEFTSPEGKTYSVTGPDGSTKEQAFQMLQSQLGSQQAAPKPEEPFGQRVNREIADIPRQVGLTARHAVEGVGDALEFVSSPIRAGLNAVLPDSMAIKPGIGKYAADKIGLPTPQNSTERVVGDAARLMAGSMVPVAGAGRLAQGAEGVTKATLQGLASNPGSQLTSAAAAGGAGGYTRETGGNDGSQLAASLAAGITAPMALSKVQQVGTSAANAFRNRVAPQNVQVDVTINNALRDSGVSFADLPANVRNSIRTDVQQAMRSDGVLSPDAIRRLADYRLTGATPRVGTLTLDPVTLTQEKNLAKIGANSKDAAAQQLAQVENANNRQLISGLNDLGAGQAQGQYATGQTLRDTLGGYATRQQGEITNLYNAAKDSQGRAARLDPQAFSTTANNLLDFNLKGAFVPDNIRTMMNDFASGRVPLNVHTAEQFKTIIGNAQRGATDGNARAALGFIRQALDNAPLIADTAVPPAAVNGGFQLKPAGGVSAELRPNIGQEAIDAFNAARGANRSFMQQVERTPSLAAAIDDAAPDAFFQKHVLNANVRDLRATLDVVGNNQGVRNSIRSEVLGYLKSEAVNGAADEAANISQSALNKALRRIGDQKLELLFDPQEIQQLKAIGRVASYEQFQPRGSAVNNSNTTAALTGVLDRIANSPLLSKIPFGNYISGPAQNISVGMQANRAMDVPRGLLSQIPLGPRPPAGLLMSPAAFMQPDEREQRGLLFP
jgi:hypothetical protein